MANHYEQETPSYRTPASETPYLKAKQVWDERMASFAYGADSWRKIAVFCMGLCILLIIGLLLSLSWHKPKLYIAEVNGQGQVMNVKLLSQPYQPTQAEEEYFITQFIKLIREVPLDPVAAKNNWRSAYGFLSARGQEVLNQFFQKNNPLSALSKKTVTVTITDINPISPSSFQVNWLEQSVDRNGQLLGQQAMSGTFTIMVQTPSTKEQMLQNPLGIYIVDFHISPKVGETK